MKSVEVAARALANAIWETNPTIEDAWDNLSIGERENYRCWARVVIDSFRDSLKASAQ